MVASGRHDVLRTAHRCAAFDRNPSGCAHSRVGMSPCEYNQERNACRTGSSSLVLPPLVKDGYCNVNVERMHAHSALAELYDRMMEASWRMAPRRLLPAECPSFYEHKYNEPAKLLSLEGGAWELTWNHPTGTVSTHSVAPSARVVMQVLHRRTLWFFGDSSTGQHFRSTLSRLSCATDFRRYFPSKIKAREPPICYESAADNSTRICWQRVLLEVLGE